MFFDSEKEGKEKEDSHPSVNSPAISFASTTDFFSDFDVSVLFVAFDPFMSFDVFLWENLLQHLWVRGLRFGHIFNVLVVEVEDIGIGLDEDKDKAE